MVAAIATGVTQVTRSK